MNHFRKTGSALKMHGSGHLTNPLHVSNRVSSHDRDETSENRGSVKDRILSAIQSGATPRQAAQMLHQPLDLVDMVIERSERNGELTILRFGNGRCGSQFCRPDPDSLVCAGCPILATTRHRAHTTHGIIARISHPIHAV